MPRPARRPRESPNDAAAMALLPHIYDAAATTVESTPRQELFALQKRRLKRRCVARRRHDARMRERGRERGAARARAACAMLLPRERRRAAEPQRDMVALTGKMVRDARRYAFFFSRYAP